MVNKLSVEELMGRIPIWCEEGALVKVDRDVVEQGATDFGLIIEYCVIDPTGMPYKEYEHMIEYNEWLIIYVCTQIGTTDYYLDEITPYYMEKVKCKSIT